MKHNKRMTAAIVSLLLILCVGVGGTLAFLADKTDTIENNFEPGNVTPGIEENFDKSTKSNVKIKNKGNVDGFIRVALVATWQKVENGTTCIAPYAPNLGTDYAMSLNIPEDTDREDNVDGAWFLSADGYYYFSEAVKPGELTDVLVILANQLEPNEDGYSLHLEVLSSAIQSDWSGDGTHPATQHWGVTVSGSTISKS